MEKPTIDHFNFVEWKYAEQCNYPTINEIVFYYHFSSFFKRTKDTVAIFKIKLKSKS